MAYFVERLPLTALANRSRNYLVAAFSLLILVFGFAAGVPHAEIWPAIGVFACLYAAALLFSSQPDQGPAFSIGLMIIVSALLSLGAEAVAATAIAGAIIAEMDHALLHSHLYRPPQTIQQAPSIIALEAGSTIFAVLPGAALFQASGGALLVLFGSVLVLHQLSLLVMSAVLCPTLNWPHRLRYSARLTILELLTLPFSLLLVAVNERLGLFALLAAGIACVGGALLYHMTQRLRELGILNAFGQALSANLSLDELLANLHQQTAKLLKVELFAVVLYEGDTGTLTFPYVSYRGERLHWLPISNLQNVNRYPASTREPLLLRGDVVAEAAKLGMRFVYPPFPVCYLSIPLILGDQLTGVISIESFTDVNAYKPSDVKLIQALTPQVAVALHNAQLYERTASMANELAQLNEVAAVVSATLDIQTISEAICQALKNLTKADKTALFLYNPDRTAMTVAYSIGFSPEYVAQFAHLPLGSFSNRTERLVVSDAQADSVEAEWRALAELGDYRALALAPLRVRDETIGLLAIFYEAVYAFRPDELERLSTLANQVSVAVANAQLYGESQRRANDMSQLVQTTQALVESLDLNAIGSILVSRIATALHLDEVALVLWDSSREQWQPVASYRDQLPDYASVDKTIFRRVADTQRPLVLPEAEDDWTLLNTLNLKTALILPLTLRAETAGVVLLGHGEERTFQTHELQFAEALMGQAATVLDNARLFRLIDTELDERIRQLSAIDAVSRKMSASLDLDTVIHEVLNAALSVTYADAAGCGLQTTTGRIAFTARMRFAPDISNTLSVWQGISGRVIRTSQYVLCGDVHQDPDYLEIVPGMKSELCVPIMRDGVALGVLDLESRHPDAFTTAHVSFMTTLADHAAVAIEKARLFSDIRRGNEQMHAILNSTRDGMILVGLHGELIQANPAAERLLNRPLQAFVGQNVIKLLAQLSQDGARAPGINYPYKELKATLRTLKKDPERVTRQVYQVMTGDGVRHVEEIGLPVQGDDRHTFARLFVLRDISEETSLERFREQVTNMIVHDLRSPLAGVIGSLKLLEDMANEGDTDQIGRVIEIAYGNADNLLRLVESILEIRRMENGLMTLERESAPLQKPVLKAIQALETLAQEGSLRLENCIPRDLPLLNVDVDKIRRVLINLLDNAIKYTPADGEIRIEAQHLPGDPMVQVRVVDTGKGIPPEYRERVFGVFVTLPGSALRGRRGTGLGLTFCRLTVEAHGGRIWAESGPEGGTAMCFTLPVAEGFTG